MTQEEFNKMLKKAIDERAIYITKGHIIPVEYGPVRYDYVIAHN